MGSLFKLVESKLRPPLTRPGIVPRTALVDRLLASQTEPVVCVVAPPGYGKTTLLAQWAERRQRVSWVSVDERDNDPAVLLTYIAFALDRVEPIDAGVFRALASPGASVTASVLPRLVGALASVREPVALALDHVEELGSVECSDVVAELAANVPTGSQLVLASRARPLLPVALLRAQGRLVEIGAEELALDPVETRALLEGAGVRLADPDVAELLGRTEGWPVGLYLAALAHKAAGPRRQPIAEVAGDHRLMADYLSSELLARLSPRMVSFLTRTAVLERMSAPLCDALLDARGSQRVLESLERSNLLVVPLDRHRQWYRYHHLFRDLLRTELGRREPESVAGLHARAAAWLEANGLPEVAIDHAQAAGDADRVARLVCERAQPAYASGRVDTARRWLQWFEDQGLIERYPRIAVIWAEASALLGDPAASERWASAAERASGEETVPDRERFEAELALLRAFLCRDGIRRMRADAQLHWEWLNLEGTTGAAALLLEGVSWLLDGDADRADPVLAHALDVATSTGAMPVASAALAERAVIAIERQDWREAGTLAERALEIVQAGNLHDYITSPLVYALVARTALHLGEGQRAHEQLARAARLRPLLTYALPWFAVQTLLELARAYLALNDAAGARTVLRQARDILRLRPDLGTLPEQAEELRAMLNTIRSATVGVSSLTTAELRLLPLLSTHLTFREIGERLHLSQHTVKSQVISVYRKLGVSSRSEAIRRVRELGLLGT